MYTRRELSLAVDRVPCFKHASLPRGPKWKDALQLLKTSDRKTVEGRRDFAILPSTGGRPVEVPLTRLVGDVLLDYLRHRRPATLDRRIFLRALAT